MPKIPYEILGNSPEKSEPQAVSQTTVNEMQAIVSTAVQWHRHRGASEASYQVGRALRISPRRVVAIMRGEVRRIWADELETARRWFAEQGELQARRNEHEAEILRLRCAKIRERLGEADQVEVGVAAALAGARAAVVLGDAGPAGGSD